MEFQMSSAQDTGIAYFGK